MKVTRLAYWVIPLILLVMLFVGGGGTALMWYVFTVYETVVPISEHPDVAAKVFEGLEPSEVREWEERGEYSMPSRGGERVAGGCMSAVFIIASILATAIVLSNCEDNGDELRVTEYKTGPNRPANWIYPLVPAVVLGALAAGYFGACEAMTIPRSIERQPEFAERVLLELPPEEAQAWREEGKFPSLIKGGQIGIIVVLTPLMGLLTLIVGALPYLLILGSTNSDWPRFEVASVGPPPSSSTIVNTGYMETVSTGVSPTYITLFHGTRVPMATLLQYGIPGMTKADRIKLLKAIASYVTELGLPIRVDGAAGTDVTGVFMSNDYQTAQPFALMAPAYVSDAIFNKLEAMGVRGYSTDYTVLAILDRIGDAKVLECRVPTGRAKAVSGNWGLVLDNILVEDIVNIHIIQYTETKVDEVTVPKGVGALIAPVMQQWWNPSAQTGQLPLLPWHT